MCVCKYMCICTEYKLILQLMGKYMLYLDHILKIIFRSYFKTDSKLNILMKKIHRYNCLPVKEVLFSY